jgi:hypothetical protein
MSADFCLAVQSFVLLKKELEPFSSRNSPACPGLLADTTKGLSQRREGNAIISC